MTVVEFERTCDNCNHYHDYSQRCTLFDCYSGREDVCDDWNGHIPSDEPTYTLLDRELPNWEMNTIAPLRVCKDKILCCGLSDTNHRDGLLWFSKKEDIEYICKALNFYETYEPIFDEFLVMVHDLEQVLKTGSTKKQQKGNKWID